MMNIMLVYLTFVLPFLLTVTQSNLGLAADLPRLEPIPEAPDVGDNKVLIHLPSEANKSINDKDLQLLFSMPAMGSMPYMEMTADIEKTSPGEFKASYEIPMGGTWEATLTVKDGENEKKYRYSLTTGIPGVTNKTQNLSAEVSGETPLLDIGPERLQLIGVRFATVQMKNLEKMIRAVGLVEQDETHREEIVARVGGYIVKQFRGRVGDHVQKGDPLFSLYSPDLVTAQSEYLLARKFMATKHAIADQPAAERLKNLGLSLGDIERIKKSGQPTRDIVFRAPNSGTILKINAREGAATDAGQIIYVIGDLTKTYIVARVFQQDVGDLAAGQRVEILTPQSGESYAGQIDLIYPQLQPGAGTVNVRVEVKEYAPFRPGSYVDLRFTVSLGNQLAIPIEAVLYSGLHQYVFIDHGAGNLEAREITTARQANSFVVVKHGIELGERVAASGTFLLSSEAQLRSALPKWRKDAKP